MEDAELKLVETLDDVFDLKEWVGQQRDWLGVDLETEGVNVGRDKIRLAQLGDRHTGWAMDYERWKGVLHETLGQYDRRIVAHNMPFEFRFLKRDGIPLRSDLIHDSMVMAHILNPMRGIGLKNVTARKYGPMAAIGEAGLKAGMSKQGWTWATVPTDFPAYWAYGALDAVLCARYAEDVWPAVQQWRLVYDVEMGCERVLGDAMLAGLRVDLDYTASKTAELRAVMDANRPLVPAEISNPGSDKQVLEYLQRNGAILWKKTEKGNLSCDDDVLAEQEERGIPGVGPIRKWRYAKWLINNYFSNITEMNVDEIIRCSVKPVGARTARMSVTDPALQTIPRGPIVRDCFIAREGHSLIMSDYDQMELRVLAHFANEEAMLQAIREGRDLHDYVAETLYSPQFTKKQRQICKNGQFAIVYGAGIPQFAHTAGIDVDTAHKFMDDYAEMFPGVRRFQDETIRQVQQNGYVETIFGRKLPVEKDKAYVGVNYICQSSATSDMLKLKIIEADNAGLGEFFRLPIHDELMFEVPDDLVPDVLPVIEEVMTETDIFRAPLNASAEVHKRWGDKGREDFA